MAAVTLTITLPTHEGRALAIIAAGLGREQFESRLPTLAQSLESHDAHSPQVKANMIDVMGEAVGKLYAALADAGFDVLPIMSRRTPIKYRRSRLEPLLRLVSEGNRT